MFFFSCANRYRKKGGLNFFMVYNALRAQLSYQTRTTSIYILDTVNELNILIW